MQNIFDRVFYKNSYQRWLVMIALMGIMHWLWIFVVEPVPSGEGQSLLYTPLQSYMHLAVGTDLPHSFITEISHNQGQYPSGFSLLAAFGVKIGLASLLMSEPFYYTFLMLLPLIGIFALHPWHGRRFVLSSLLFFSFPPLQICLRSFSPHGFNVIFSLGGSIIFLKGWQRRSPFLLVIGFLFLWFSAVLKHLGLWLGIGLVFSLIFWSVLRRKQVFAALGFCFLFLLLTLPWYPWDGLLFYIDSLSQFQKLPHVKSCIIAALLTFSLAVLVVLRGQGKRRCPLCFKNGWLLLLIFYFSIWCTVKFFGNSLTEGLNTPTILIIVGGYALLAFLPYVFSFQSERGLLLLFTYISWLNAVILYFSRFGNNPAVWYFPACLALYMTVRETKRTSVYVFLIGIFAYISNFTPSLAELLQQGSPLSVLRYQDGWSGFPNHFLSWQKHELRKPREEIYKIMSEYQFTNTEHNTGFFRFMDGHLVEQSGLFYQNWYQPFPVCKTISWERIDLLISLSRQSDIEDIFSVWLAEGLFAYIVAANPDWSKDPLFGQGINFYTASEQELLRILNYDNPTIERDVECFFWDFLQENNRLENNYDIFVIGPFEEFKLYLFKGLVKDVNAGKIFHWQRLKNISFSKRSRRKVQLNF